LERLGCCLSQAWSRLCFSFVLFLFVFFGLTAFFSVVELFDALCVTVHVVRFNRVLLCVSRAAALERRIEVARAVSHVL